MKQFYRLVMLLVIALYISGIAQAQNGGLPLVLQIDGDIYTWTPGDAALTRLTTWRYNSDMVMSPDSTQIAYYSLPQMVVDAIAREGGFGGGKLPGNIWTMDSITNQAYRAGSQPKDASFAVQGILDKAIVRSTPMWSPDGTQLAWTEFDYPEDGSSKLRLVVFDRTTTWQKVIADDVPFPAGVPTAMDGVWTDAGLMLNHYTMDPATGNMSNMLLVYSPDGKLINQVVYDENSDRILSMAVPVRSNGITLLAALVLDRPTDVRAWQVIDPLTPGAQWQPAPATPEQVAMLNPERSYRLRWTNVPLTGRYHDTVTIVSPEGVDVTPAVAANTWLSSAVLSPDGQKVAYRIFDPNAITTDFNVYVWDAATNSVQTVPLPPNSPAQQQIAWGAMTWVIPG